MIQLVVFQNTQTHCRLKQVCIMRALDGLPEYNRRGEDNRKGKERLNSDCLKTEEEASHAAILGRNCKIRHDALTQTL